MRSAFFVAALVSIATAPVAARAQSSRGSTADVILTGGRVFTSDTSHLWAEAVAIRGERILAVGTDAEIERLARPATRRIALGGRVVVPGLNDAHDHLGDVPFAGEFRTSIAPTPDPALSQIVDSIRVLAGRTPAGTWLKGTIGRTVLNDTLARRAALDRVAGSHPVLLSAWWGHGAILNSAGLRALGIPDTAADPLGGWYERDAAGRLTGRLNEYAEWGAIRRIYSSLPDSVIVAGLRAFADSSLRTGVTSVQDMAGYLDPARTLRVFAAARLPIRVRLIRWSIPDATSRNEREWNRALPAGTERLTLTGRKWVLDGTPTEQFALMRSEYAGRPGWHGRLDFPLDTVRAILADALRPGAAQLHLHIVGDSTTELVLSAMERLAPDSVWRTRRVRFEHGRGILGAQVARARRLGIVIAQPRAGAPFHTWLAAGIPLAYGSDALRDPFFNMMNTVAPRGADQSEALTREQAVIMYTRGSAYAERAEARKGTLAPGMFADLAVLSQDIFSVPAKLLPGTTSVLTIVGGRVVRDELSGGTGRRP